jgi:hypothetical protein
MSSILIALESKSSITVSPFSVRVQNFYNSQARMLSELSPAVVTVNKRTGKKVEEAC